MNILLTKEFVTKRVLKLSLILTVILAIWHFTLLKSDAPYINSVASWMITILSPVLACIGIHAIVIMYKKWFGSKAAGELAQAGGGDLFLNISGHSIEAFFIILALVIIIPIVFFIIPSGVLVGIAYHKHTLWQDIVYNLTEYTNKEQIFVAVISIFLGLGISTLIWDILIIIAKILVRLGNWIIK